MADLRTLGVLSSGGDCAGLNAMIRTVTYHAVQGYGLGIHLRDQRAAARA